MVIFLEKLQQGSERIRISFGQVDSSQVMMSQAPVITFITMLTMSFLTIMYPSSRKGGRTSGHSES
jgi:hypothetical protein